MAKNICPENDAMSVVHWDTMQETVKELGKSTMREKEAIMR